MSNAATRPPSPDQPAATTSVPVFVARLAVRWHDLDTFNHVNNSTYLTYLEESRLQWMLTLSDWYSTSAMPVLAASVLNYRRPIAWPATLQVHLSCTRLGNTSITLAHRIVDADDDTRLYCDGHVVMVWMDPATGKPVGLPASIRAAAGAPTGS
ncbi:MAG TPA: thioesterase family protein [Rhodanobacter sp.]|jgi:acyl-CoA thioester hydrolase|nr:thioesterase family protein [Rhodanobacter sp.]